MLGAEWGIRSSENTPTDAASQYLQRKLCKNNYDFSLCVANYRGNKWVLQTSFYKSNFIKAFKLDSLMQDHEEFCVMLEMQQKHDSTWTLDREDDAGATMIIYHLSLYFK